jgi:TM2 domain-containing membrane protein YozV
MRNGFIARHHPIASNNMTWRHNKLIRKPGQYEPPQQKKNYFSLFLHYNYKTSSWSTHIMNTHFCSQCGNKINTDSSFCEKCRYHVSNEVQNNSPKSARTALLLCLFLGAIGAHRFYVGKIGTGILMLLTWGGLGIWVLVDIILIASCQFRDKKNQLLIFTQEKGSTTRNLLKIIGYVVGCLIIYVTLLITFLKENGEWKIIHIEMPSAAAGIETEQNQKNTITNNDAPLIYQDPIFHYSITYPGNWEYEKTKTNHILFGGKKGTLSYYTTVTIQVLPVKKWGGSYDSVTQITQDLKQQIQTGATQVDIAYEKDAELPLNKQHVKGKSFIASYVYQDVPMKKLQFVLEKEGGEYYYIFSYTAPERIYADELPTAKKMYESWDIQ